MKISPIEDSLLDSRASPLRKLDALLDSFEMSREEIQDIRTFIKQTSLEILDATKTYTEQPNAIPKIVKAIKAKYPELFGGDTDPSRVCLALALKCASYFFNGHRKCIRHKARKTLMRSHCRASPSSKFSDRAASVHPVFTPAQPTKRFYPHGHGHARRQSDGSSKRSSLFPTEMTPTNPFLATPFNSQAPIYETSDNELSSSDTIVHRPHADLLPKSPSNPSQLLFPSTLPKGGRSHASQEWHRPSTERTNSPCKTSMQTETPEERDDFLYHFLESCPTHGMTRLYSALAHVDLSHTYIRVMGTTWTVEQIQNFLRKIFASTCDAGGAVVPDIDIIFLAHHFINYFSRCGPYS